MQSWILALKQGKRRPTQAQYKYGASIVQEKLGKRLYVPSLSVPLVDGELDRLGEITVKLDKVVKQLRPLLLGLAQARTSTDAATDDEEGASDYKSAGLSEVEEILRSLRNADTKHNADSSDEGTWSGMEDKERKLITAVLSGTEIGEEQPTDEE